MRVKLYAERNEPDDKDFHITPALMFGSEEWENTKAYGIAIAWGYWQVVLGVAFNLKQKV